MSNSFMFVHACVSTSPTASPEVLHLHGFGPAASIGRAPLTEASRTHTPLDSTAIFMGTSVLVAGRSLQTTRAAQAKKKRRQRESGGAVLLDRSDGFRPLVKESSTKGRKPSTQRRPSKKENLITPAKSVKDLTRQEKPIEQPLSIPVGATTNVDQFGKDVLFAGGLVGGQGIFANSDNNFDPLGLSEKLPFMLPFFRESELKHGRLAMLGFLGLVVPQVVTIPGLAELAPKCAAAGKGGELRVVEAHKACMVDHLPLVNVSPMMLLLAAVSMIEIVTSLQKIVLGWGLTIKNAGDYPGRQEIGSFLNQLPDTETDMVVRKLQELKHGRLAMIAFSGAWVQGVLTANGFPWIW